MKGVVHRSLILVADDNSDDLGILAEILRTAGHTVTTAASGNQAVNTAYIVHPDLIILKTELPDMSGYTLCRKIRADGRLGDVPVLFSCSAEDLEETRSRAFELGSCDYFTRPFNREEVLARVGTQLLLRFHEQQPVQSETRRTAQHKQQCDDTCKALLNATIDGIILIDSSGVIIDINDNMSEILRTERESVIGTSIYSRMQLDLAEQHRFKAVEAFSSGETIRFQESQTDRVFENSVYPIFDRDGNLFRFAVYSHDITERVQLEENLFQLQKMEALGQLAGGIAHDFNNVLGSIMGSTEIALGGAPKGSQQEKALNRVMSAAQRATSLVQRILSFSRKEPSDRRLVAVGPIVEEVIQLLRASLPSSIEIASEIKKANKKVYANATQLHEVVMNLCTNAAHAMNESGLLSISCYEKIIEDGMRGCFGEIPQGIYCVTEVKDNGCGMDDKVLSRIFEPFYTTKDAGEGTGMGLAVVFNIMQTHGGNILVESIPGKGTTFQVLLPATVSSHETTEIDNSPIPGGTERILLIDDEEMIIEIVTELLGELGYHVIAFQNSEEALSAFEREPKAFDIVITDQTMPGLTGIELARKITAIEKDIPIILCTGYSKVVDEEKARQAGIKSLVMKPFNKRELAQHVRKVLD